MFAFGIVTLAMEWIFTLGAERLDESPQPWIFNYTYRAVGIMALGWIACFMSMSYSASTLGMTFKALQNLDVTLLPLPIVVEEKFPKENFRVNREMRDEILVYESVLEQILCEILILGLRMQEN